MIFYHGSPELFNQFLPPNKTGIIRDCEKHRKVNLDVVFFTDIKNYAKIYATKKGYIYEIEIISDDFEMLLEKKSHSHVFFTKAENIKILNVIKN